jgi:putative transposase
VFRFIDAARANHPVALMCQVLGVSRSGYYAWTRRGPSARAQSDAELLTQIHQIHAQSRGCSSAPRCTWSCATGLGWGRKRVARLIPANGLHGRCGRLPGPKTTRRERQVELPLPDLVGRKFEAANPDQAWCADITYVRTWECWL